MATPDDPVSAIGVCSKRFLRPRFNVEIPRREYARAPSGTADIAASDPGSRRHTSCGRWLFSSEDRLGSRSDLRLHSWRNRWVRSIL